jgi:hypothetical protein
MWTPIEIMCFPKGNITTGVQVFFQVFPFFLLARCDPVAFVINKRSDEYPGFFMVTVINYRATEQRGICKGNATPQAAGN